MIRETILAIIIAFAVSALLCPVIIPFLHKLKFGQQVRDDGPQSHLKKQGTPTMGGLIILTSIIITSVFYIPSYPRIIPVLFMTVGFGIIGFLDDYIKIIMKRSEGLNPIQKLIGQFIITGIFVYYLVCSDEVGTSMLVPFTGGFEHGIYLDLGFLFIPFVFFVVLGTDNGVNFTDGLDGLSSSVTLPVALFFAVMGAVWGGFTQLGVFAGAMFGGLLGFLYYNHYPAKVFMGDTGSLFLGGAIAALAFAYDMPLILLLVGFVYLCETLSDIIQVAYFKATHGKRIFKMAPLHHHFEMCGWNEKKIVAVFTAVSALMCLLAYWGVADRFSL